jgi:hypothetical protein
VPIASLTGWGSLYLVKPRVKNWLDVTTTVVTMIRIASPPGLDIVE